MPRRKVGRPKGSKNKKRSTRRRRTTNAQLGKGFFGDLAKTLVPIVAKAVIPQVTKKVFGSGLTPPGRGLKLAGRGHPRRKPRYTPYYTRTPRGRYVYK